MNEEMMMETTNMEMTEGYEETENTTDSGLIGKLLIGAGAAALGAAAIMIAKRRGDSDKKAEREAARQAKKHEKMIRKMEKEGFIVMRKEAYQEVCDEIQSEEEAE